MQKEEYKYILQSILGTPAGSRIPGGLGQDTDILCLLSVSFLRVGSVVHV